MRVVRSLLALAAVPLALAACSPEEAGPALNEGELKRAFETAAIEEGVPEDLLLAVGWYESRWVHVQPEAAHDDKAEPGHGPSNDGFHGGYGLMQLSDREDHDTLGLAAQLLEQDPATLKADAAANVRGAAAVLRRYADEMYEGVEIEGLDLFAWRDVVARWSGMDDPQLAYEVADEIFAIMREGAGRTLETGEHLELFPNPGLGSAEEDAPATGGTGDIASREDGLGMAGVPFVPASSRNYTNGRSASVRYVVIHTTQGSYAGTISWFKNPAARVSAHYVVRSRDGATTQMVDENDTGWHAGNWSYNAGSVGIEHEGFVNDPEWYTDAMYRASARLTCDIARRHRIPVDRQHIIGHNEVPGATHTDPGRHWNWNYYMQLVRNCGGGGAPQPPADNPNQGGGGGVNPGQGTIQGIVYADGNTNQRIGGASVRLSNGLTATTASNGHWSLRVNAGSYTVTASKSGFASASVTRNVSGGGQTWASTSLRSGGGGGPAPAAPGRVTGVVFEGSDSSRRIGGARIAAAGRSATTDANGRYSLELPPGQHTLDISASGFLSKQLPTSIRSGQASTVNAGMVRRAQKGQLVGVVYALPSADNRIGGAKVTISNGAQSLSTTSAANGYWEFKNIDVGTWRITASAPGYAAGSRSGTALTGQERWASVGLQRAGKDGTETGTIIGVVYESPNTSKRIPGARVTLSSGATVTADQNGVYQAPARGTITIVASAPGFASRAITRTVHGGMRIWGSIGLTRGTPGSAGGNELECDPKGIPVPHDPPEDIELKSPRHNETVGPTPTFEFTGVGDDEASYVVVVMQAGRDDRTLEFKVPPGEAPRATAPSALPAGVYTWSVYAIWEDCERTEPIDWAFFTVK